MRGYGAVGAEGPQFAPDVRPERPADLRAVWTDDFAAMEAPVAELLRMLAVARLPGKGTHPFRMSGA